MNRFILFITILIIVLPIMGGSPVNKTFPYEYKVKSLDNGLKVIMIPMQSNGIVAYYSVVRTGSRDEWEPGHTGFAHFFEHMMFRGTKRYPGRVYDSLVTSMGADANAYTTDDYTCYHLSIAKEDLEQVMNLESDRFQNLFYEEREFQTESGAVYGEYRKSKTSPYFLLEEKMCETAFDKHTYKHTTMGFEKDIAAMPSMYEYSRSFFERYYRPENVVIVIVGDFDPDASFNLVKKYYGNWKKGYVTPQIESEPEQKGERIADVKYPGKTLPILAVSYKGAAYNPNDVTAISAILLGDLAFGSNSELNKKLYIKEQKVQFVEPSISLNRDPTLWSIYSMVKSEKDIDYIKSEIYNTVAKFQATLVDAKELEKQKKHMKYSFLMELDAPDKVAGRLARIVALTGGIDAVDSYFATVDKITPKDIQDAAKKYFVPEKRTVLTLTGSK
ncbi:MAG: insulinase family protein [Ignavibacteriae bacterium]|nr:insulinase family protein [Ignavibacteriota bacterium]